MATDARARARARERALDGLAAGAAASGVAAVRPEIRASWRRVRTNGLGPDDNPAVPPLAEAELEGRRAVSPLADLLPHLRGALQPVVDAGLLVVVTDTDGRVLWRTGEDKVTRQADRLGFVGGSAWTEYNVGTNAIGTSLVLGRPVLIRGSEHYVESHTVWSCAAAPLHDVPAGVPVDLLICICNANQAMQIAGAASTRIGTFLLAHDGSNRNFPDLNISEGHHDLSHHDNNPEKLEKIAKITRFYVEQLGYFLDRLQNTEDGEGQNLLDNSMVLYGSGLADPNRHDHSHLPVLLAGRGGGQLTPGRHVDVGNSVPMSNLYVSMLNKLGVPATEFGDSTGPLEGV